ncbi:hypothetical protein ACHOLT_20595 [Desulfitobacterium sp. Sab5]|uniref:hypothetical protein n=1 Tax=Desulfitobacterium nosdiversum TaxID=3375356 RepID=UPI003CF5BA44
MLKEIGGFLGDIVYILFLLALLNYVVKYINRKFRNQLLNNEAIYQLFIKLMKFTVKNHRYFGLMAIIFLLLHTAVQMSLHGINITGTIAVVIMLAEIGLGYYGSKVKKKGKTWLKAHRVISVLLLISIFIHLALG